MTTAARAAALLLVVVACQSAPGPSDVPTLDASQLRFSCGGPAFPLEALSGPLGAERADDPAANVLRAHLAGSGPDFDMLPDEGYRLVARTEVTALYIAETDRLDSGLAQVSLALNPEGWQVTGWGDCRPEVAFEGASAASWELDGGQRPDGTTFVALVTERACANGRSSEGRVLPPLILFDERQVIVIFGVRSAIAPEDVLDPCPGNPATRVTVELREPLGDRQLLDGGTHPPHEPTDPSSR